MTALDRLDQARAWGEYERLLVDQVQRLADEVIAPAAAEHDREGSFP